MAQAKTLVVNPHFKGLVNFQNGTAVSIVTGKFGCGEAYVPLTEEAYLDAVRRCAEECPALAQTLARSIAAAIVAVDAAAHGRDVRLVSVEGCIHRVGPFEATGSKIVGSIWESVVEPHVQLPPQAFIDGSCCTVEESRLIVQEALRSPGAVEILCITHGYHRERVDWTLRDAIRRARADDKLAALPTITPDDVLQTSLHSPRYQFLREVILAAAVSIGCLEKEQRAERLIRWLYRVSRWTERLTLGGVNIETWLASRRRHALQQ